MNWIHIDAAIGWGQFAFLALPTMAIVIGCASDRDEVAGWEDFRAESETIVDGRIGYRVEWDLPVANEAELRRYYDSHYGTAADDGIAPSRGHLAVNTVGGVDDLWSHEDAVDLRYCVSDTFGSDYSRAVTEMAEAVRGWMSVANVRFVYVPAEDDDCTTSNGNIDFPVRPWSSGGACAFFPSGGGCIGAEGTLVMDFDDLDTNPFYATNAPNLTTTGVFRHELGHILGFRHEHIRPEAGNCFGENSNWRALTSYDISSVMHYQWCNGALTSDLSLTASDVAGSIAAYGMSTALLAAVL